MHPAANENMTKLASLDQFLDLVLAEASALGKLFGGYKTIFEHAP